jgi:hypothetical protein
VLVLPDGDDLFNSLNHVSTRGERVGAMRRHRHDDDARLTDVYATRAVMHSHARVRPCLADLFRDSLERTHGERLVRFVLEERHAAALVVIADETDERCHRTIARARLANLLCQPLQVQCGRSHSDERHRSSIASLGTLTFNL